MIVTYNQAEKLKKVGFDRQTVSKYVESTKEFVTLYEYQRDKEYQTIVNWVKAPTISEALQWIRDNKGIVCAVNVVDTEKYYGVQIKQNLRYVLTELFDTHYIPNTFKGLNQILIEANYEERILNENLIDGKIDNMRYQRVLRSHMSLETTIEALKKNDLKGVRNIVLIHLSPQNSDAALFKSKVVEATGKNTHIALKGLVIDFNKEPF